MSAMSEFKYRKDQAAAYEDSGPAYFVMVNGVAVGSVEKVESTETGFKRGHCIGQVPCKRWVARDIHGRRLPGRKEIGGFDNGFKRRDEAARAVIAARTATT
jgi:hypothetical protein